MQTSTLIIDAWKAHKVKLPSGAPISLVSLLILDLIKLTPMSSQDLSRTLKIKPPAMTGNADFLEKQGYAKRIWGTVNPKTGKPDGRMCELKILPKGKSLLRRVLADV